MVTEEMTAEECRKALSTEASGRLALVRNGQPYVVPVSFVVDGHYAYLRSISNQKIEWMRPKPRVCLEVDGTNTENDCSIVVLGRFEELRNTKEYRPQRLRAQRLLRHHFPWWQRFLPEVADRAVRQDVSQVFCRIGMGHMMGRRGGAASDEASPVRQDVSQVFYRICSQYLLDDDARPPPDDESWMWSRTS
jgi:nitroimidazol reductase NimA-like FMN-containing flavoprotein (pyridoxamine 5'-phosphate oxidase superfamily)